jgi:hypothetical protein
MSLHSGSQIADVAFQHRLHKCAFCILRTLHPVRSDGSANTPGTARIVASILPSFTHRNFLKLNIIESRNAEVGSIQNLSDHSIWLIAESCGRDCRLEMIG